MDWKTKLTSRKFWMALGGFVGMLVVALGGSAEGAERIAAMIMAGASVIAYIIGEGMVDAQHVMDEAREGEKPKPSADASVE